MAFWCLFDIIYEFRCSKPALLSFNFTICGCPSNFTAKGFKVSLALFPLFLEVKVNSSGMEKMMDEGAVEEVVSAIHYHAEEPNVMQNACGCLGTHSTAFSLPILL